MSEHHHHDPIPPLQEGYLQADMYGYQGVLSPVEREIVAKVREFLETEVRPRANEFWDATESPRHLLKRFAELDIVGLGYDFEDRPAASKVLSGWLGMEFARVDPSTGTMFGVHNGLAMGSISALGSEEQKAKWLPAMRRMEKVGAFGLSEPHGGSDVAGGMETTARLDGDEWVLNGAKRWIGNGTFADVVVVFAKDEADGEVKGFLVEKDFPGFSSAKIEGKYALRAVQNADLTFTDCRVPAANKLEHANSFADTAKVLRLTRGGVAWSAVGVMIGAFEKSVTYSQERVQFGKPIGSFQLISDLIARQAANLTASLGMALRVAQLQDDGIFHDEQAAMCKSYCTTRLRENVAWAREIYGGNGIVLENDVIRFFADAEALYSYEGTSQMNNLIVGRAFTGLSAFV